MKIALVHDFLKEYGGAERVLEALHEIWPEAPVYTSFFLAKKLPDHFKSWDIRESYLRKVPLISKISKLFTFFYPWIFESLDLSEYDVIISSTASFAKGIITKPNQLHICYCHTVPRFLYHYPAETNRRQLWYLKPGLAMWDHWLRVWDFWAAQRVDELVVNSCEVKRRVSKFYRRTSTVIHPPVDIQKFQISNNSRKIRNSQDYFLVVSRLSAYKNIDLAIKACNKLKANLKIVGVGREEMKLRKIAGSTVEFFGSVPDEKLASYYQNSKAVFFPSEDDFGIVPIEAMACGKPVIALAKGGALETIIQHSTGEFFAKPDVDSLINVLKYFEPEKYSPDACRKQAEKFSKEQFEKKIKEFIEDKWQKYNQINKH